MTGPRIARAYRRLTGLRESPTAWLEDKLTGQTAPAVSGPK